MTKSNNDKKQDLGQLVWVRDGTANHLAYLVVLDSQAVPINKSGQVLIQWQTNNRREYVAHDQILESVLQDTQERRRRQTRSNLPQPKLLSVDETVLKQEKQQKHQHSHQQKQQPKKESILQPITESNKSGKRRMTFPKPLPFEIQVPVDYDSDVSNLLLGGIEEKEQYGNEDDSDTKFAANDEKTPFALTLQCKKRKKNNTTTNKSEFDEYLPNGRSGKARKTTKNTSNRNKTKSKISLGKASKNKRARTYSKVDRCRQASQEAKQAKNELENSLSPESPMEDQNQDDDDDELSFRTRAICRKKQVPSKNSPVIVGRVAVGVIMTKTPSPITSYPPKTVIAAGAATTVVTSKTKTPSPTLSLTTMDLVPAKASTTTSKSIASCKRRKVLSSASRSNMASSKGLLVAYNTKSSTPTIANKTMNGVKSSMTDILEQAALKEARRLTRLLNQRTNNKTTMLATVDSSRNTSLPSSSVNSSTKKDKNKVAGEQQRPPTNEQKSACETVLSPTVSGTTEHTSRDDSMTAKVPSSCLPALATTAADKESFLHDGAPRDEGSEAARGGVDDDEEVSREAHELSDDGDVSHASTSYSLFESKTSSGFTSLYSLTNSNQGPSSTTRHDADAIKVASGSVGSTAGETSNNQAGNSPNMKIAPSQGLPPQQPSPRSLPHTMLDKFTNTYTEKSVTATNLSQANSFETPPERASEQVLASAVSLSYVFVENKKLVSKTKSPVADDDHSPKFTKIQIPQSSSNTPQQHQQGQMNTPQAHSYPRTIILLNDESSCDDDSYSCGSMPHSKVKVKQQQLQSPTTPPTMYKVARLLVQEDHDLFTSTAANIADAVEDHLDVQLSSLVRLKLLVFIDDLLTVARERALEKTPTKDNDYIPCAVVASERHHLHIALKESSDLALDSLLQVFRDHTIRSVSLTADESSVPLFTQAATLFSSMSSLPNLQEVSISYGGHCLKIVQLMKLFTAGNTIRKLDLANIVFSGDDDDFQASFEYAQVLRELHLVRVAPSDDVTSGAFAGWLSRLTKSTPLEKLWLDDVELSEKDIVPLCQNSQRLELGLRQMPLPRNIFSYGSLRELHLIDCDDDKIRDAVFISSSQIKVYSTVIWGKVTERTASTLFQNLHSNVVLERLTISIIDAPGICRMIANLLKENATLQSVDVVIMGTGVPNATKEASLILRALENNPCMKVFRIFVAKQYEIAPQSLQSEFVQLSRQNATIDTIHLFGEHWQRKN